MSKRGVGLIVTALLAALIVVVAGLLVYQGTRPIPIATIKLIGFGRGPTLVAAERKGFFDDEHLKVEFTQTPSSAVQIRGVLDGKWDLALTAPDNVMAYVEKENADLFGFMVADLGLNQKLFVRPEISSWGDLCGKAIGVDAWTPASPSWWCGCSTATVSSPAITSSSPWAETPSDWMR